jgi:hypothetical protein
MPSAFRPAVAMTRRPFLFLARETTCGDSSPFSAEANAVGGGGNSLRKGWVFCRFMPSCAAQLRPFLPQVLQGWPVGLKGSPARFEVCGGWRQAWQRP